MLIGEPGAEALIHQFSMLWQNQWLRGVPPENIRDLLEAWISELSQLPQVTVDRACLIWKSKPYPPDLAAFISSTHRTDAEELFRMAEDVANQVTPDFSNLPPIAYAAGKEFGWATLRETGWHSKYARARWTEIVSALEKYDDLNLLPPSPPKPAGILYKPKTVIPANIENYLRNFREKIAQLE